MSVRDWLSGVAGALRIAVIYAVIAGVAYALRGNELREQVGVGFGSVVLLYLGGACVAGSLVGLLLPVAERSAIGAAMVGFIAMLPVSLVVGFLVVPAEDFGVVPILAVVQALFYGGVGGPYLRSRALSED